MNLVFVVLIEQTASLFYYFCVLSCLQFSIHMSILFLDPCNLFKIIFQSSYILEM